MPLNFDLAVNTGTEVYQDDYLFDRSYFPYLRSPVPQELRESADIDVRIVAVPFRENTVSAPASTSSIYMVDEYDVSIDETTRMMADATVLQDLSDRIITIHTIDEIDLSGKTMPLDSMEIVLDNSDFALYDLDSGEMGALTQLGMVTIEWTYSNGVTSHTDKGQPWFLISSIAFDDEDFTVTVSMLDIRVLYSGSILSPYTNGVIPSPQLDPFTSLVPLKSRGVRAPALVKREEGVHPQRTYSAMNYSGDMIRIPFTVEGEDAMNIARQTSLTTKSVYFCIRPATDTSPSVNISKYYDEEVVLRPIITYDAQAHGTYLHRYLPYCFVSRFFGNYDYLVPPSNVVVPPHTDTINPVSIVECELVLNYTDQTVTPNVERTASATASRDADIKYIRGETSGIYLTFKGVKTSSVGFDYDTIARQTCDMIVTRQVKYARNTYTARVTGVPEYRAGDRVLMEDRQGVMGVYRVLKADTTYDGSVTIDLTMYMMDSANPTMTFLNNKWGSVKVERFGTWDGILHRYASPSSWGDLLYIDTGI